MHKKDHIATFKIAHNTDLKNGNRQSNPFDDNEEKIWIDFLDGDQESTVYIYEKYINQLYSYGYQFCREKYLLEDYIQELFYTIISKRQSLSKIKSIKGYLFSSLKRKILRSGKTGKYETPIDDAFIFTYERKAIPLYNSMKESDFELVYKKINELPTSQREVIFLFFYQGMKYFEVAEIMDIKVETARKHIYRALKHLKQEIGPHLSDFYLFLILINLGE